MECLSHRKIQEYINGDFSNMENAMVRDHLIVCGKCKLEYDYYEKLEKFLNKPEYITPPEIIERSVLKQLFPRVPAYTSVFALMAASFLLVISWIYIYFDFANNSLIQAIQMTSDNTSNWIGSIIKVISSIFSGVYAVFRVLNALLEVVFNVNMGVEIVGIVTFALFSSLLYLLSQKIFKKLKGTDV